MLTHFSCFSGIGGIDLAAEWAGFQTVGQVEKEDYPFRILCKHWPDVPKWRDIKDVSGTEIKSLCGNVTVLSGGFPCQPHSFAGKRKGSADERNLWPELRRVISEVRPKWFLGENVPGVLSSNSGQFFAGVLRDLAEMRYNVAWCCWEAARVGAPHRRNRVFIVAYSNDCRLLHGQAQELTAKAREYAFGEPESGCPDVPNTNKLDDDNRRYGASKIPQFKTSGIPGSKRWQSESGICRVANGIPDRVDRIKALGNAVVPQQVYPILDQIARIEIT